MAKIVVEFDTATKMMSVTKDGQTLDNVHDVSGFKMWSEKEDDEPKFSMRVTRVEKEEDMVTYTTISANEKFKREVTAVEDAIAAYFDGVL